MAGPLYLADTNILIRLMKRDHLEYPLVRGAVNALREEGVKLGYTLQNMAEFWNACTRPAERNGYGLTVEETEIGAQDIERSFTFVPDSEGTYRAWRRIVLLHKVSGAQVHDARLAAAMYANGMTHIVTFNVTDFGRFEGITAVHPNSVSPGKVRH